MPYGIPPELRKFLEKRGTSLLINGREGTGKTTLTFQIIDSFRDSTDCFYISTRVSPEKLYTQLPFVKELLPAENIIDSTSDTLEKIVEKVAVKAGGSKHPMVIVDSWDGIAKQIDLKERIRMEQELLNIAGNPNAVIIFISEEPEQTTLSYLVDGVVTLRKYDKDQRRVRSITLDKLRATEILQHTYLYTLRGGRFTYFRHFEVPEQKEKKLWEKRDDSDVSFSTGSEDLDKVFGGFRKGSNVFIELMEPHVPRSAYNVILASVAWNFLSDHRGIKVFPLPGIDAKGVTKILSRHAEPEVIEYLLRVAEKKNVNKNQDSPVIVTYENLNQQEDLEKWKQLGESLRKDTGKPHLEILGYDGILSEMKLQNLIEYLGNTTAKIRESKDLVLGVLRAGDPEIAKEIGCMSDTYVRLTEEKGAILLYGLKPDTPFYNLECVLEDNLLKIRLTPLI